MILTTKICGSSVSIFIFFEIYKVKIQGVCPEACKNRYQICPFVHDLSLLHI